MIFFTESKNKLVLSNRVAMVLITTEHTHTDRIWHHGPPWLTLYKKKKVAPYQSIKKINFMSYMGMQSLQTNNNNKQTNEIIQPSRQHRNSHHPIWKTTFGFEFWTRCTLNSLLSCATETNQHSWLASGAYRSVVSLVDHFNLSRLDPSFFTLWDENCCWQEVRFLGDGKTDLRSGAGGKLTSNIHSSYVALLWYDEGRKWSQSVLEQPKENIW